MTNNNEKGVPVRWNISENIVARYATNMVIQQLENEVLISFFEIKPPIILGSPEQIQKQLEELGSVNADCVAQIIVAKNKMPNFIEALESNFKKSLENKEDEE